MSGGTNFCNPEALIAFADRTEAIGESIDGFVGRLADARVARDAFGRMPGIGERIHTAYDEHVDETELGIEQARSALLGAGAAAATSAAEWMVAEAESIGAISEVGGDR